MTRRRTIAITAAAASVAAVIAATCWMLAAINMPPSPFGERWGDVQ